MLGNVRNVANRSVFSMIRGSGCSKSRLAKAAGAEVAVQQRNEKWHAAVARSTFASQNIQNTSARDEFWMLRSGKMARRCGAKRICKSKCEKTDGYGPLFALPQPLVCMRWCSLHVKLVCNARTNVVC